MLTVHCKYCSAPEVTTIWRYTNVYIIIIIVQTSMSVVVRLGRKCTLAASPAAVCKSRWVCAARPFNVGKKMGQTGGRTDARPMHFAHRYRRGQHSKRSQKYACILERWDDSFTIFFVSFCYKKSVMWAQKKCLREWLATPVAERCCHTLIFHCIFM